jgi:hypothetical protein
MFLQNDEVVLVFFSLLLFALRLKQAPWAGKAAKTESICDWGIDVKRVGRFSQLVCMFVCK